MPISRREDIEYTNPSEWSEEINYAILEFTKYHPVDLCSAVVPCTKAKQ